jgi:hypothetical protein
MEGKRVNRFITDYGEDIRVESTDVVLTKRPKAWRIYKRVKVTDGIHPVHQTQTTVSDVWVFVIALPRAEAAEEYVQKMLEGEV